jgi:hypothetical protein
MWTREALEARVAKLAEEHEGQELVDAVVAFGEQLDDGERELLGKVLLERAPSRSPKDETEEYPRWRVILPRFRSGRP